MCLLFTIKRPSRFRPPSTTKRRALAPASFAASLRPQGLDMIVLLGRRKKAGPCTGRVERRQFCNTNNPAESRRQPSWFSRDGNHARLLQPLPLRHGQPLEFVIVDNADHDRCEDEVRMMHEQIIPQLPRLPGFDQAVHQVDQQDLQGDNKQAEAFRLTQGQRSAILLAPIGLLSKNSQPQLQSSPTSAAPKLKGGIDHARRQRLASA